MLKADRHAMSYAALLALLLVLSFSIPFLVRLGERLGVPPGLGVVTAFVTVVFILGWIVIRWRVKKRLAIEERIAEVVLRRAERPDATAAFYSEGEHVGDLLLSLGRYREALAEYEAHILVAERAGEDCTRMQAVAEKVKQDYAL
jgi:hypothetical protein